MFLFQSIMNVNQSLDETEQRLSGKKDFTYISHKLAMNHIFKTYIICINYDTLFVFI